MTEAEKKEVNLAELSDDEIMNLDPEALPEDTEEDTPSDPGTDQEEGEPGAAEDETEGNQTDDPGGAESVEDLEVDPGEEGTTSDEEDGEPGTEEDEPGAEENEPEVDQTSDDSSTEEGEAAASSSETDYKAELAKVLAPFKAAKREIKVNTPEDARRLMQMGVDYSRKMEAMKPYQKVLKTLERNDLLDIDKVNFMIDLDKKDPAAIKKFLKDHAIDPMDIDLEDNTGYEPTDHSPSDKELAVDAVIDGIRGSASFDATVKVITEDWDKASRQILLDEPDVIRIINDHVGAGIYEKITDRLENERVFGKHAGLSDLEAYKNVGDAMFDAGEFGNPKGAPQTTAPASEATQDEQDPKGSDESDAKRKARRKAASPTKGSAATKKKVVDFSKFTDEQIEAFDIDSL